MIPPGRISGPTPVLSSSLRISSFVRLLGCVSFPPKDGRYANSIENDASRGSNVFEASDGRGDSESLTDERPTAACTQPRTGKSALSCVLMSTMVHAVHTASGLKLYQAQCEVIRSSTAHMHHSDRAFLIILLACVTKKNEANGNRA